MFLRKLKISVFKNPFVEMFINNWHFLRGNVANPTVIYFLSYWPFGLYVGADKLSFHRKINH